MKSIQLLLQICMVFLGVQQVTNAQEKWVIRNHPLCSFKQYDGDTVKYLRQNFDGGADDNYRDKPINHFLHDMDPDLPIKTCVPYYAFDPEEKNLVGFYCLVYTENQLKQMVEENRPIYAIGLLFDKWVNRDRESEVYWYIRSLGSGLLPWTAEIEQKIGHLSFDNGSIQELPVSIRDYIKKL